MARAVSGGVAEASPRAGEVHGRWWGCATRWSRPRAGARCPRRGCSRALRRRRSIRFSRHEKSAQRPRTQVLAARHGTARARAAGAGARNGGHARTLQHGAEFVERSARTASGDGRGFRLGLCEWQSHRAPRAPGAHGALDVHGSSTPARVVVCMPARAAPATQRLDGAGSALARVLRRYRARRRVSPGSKKAAEFPLDTGHWRHGACNTHGVVRRRWWWRCVQAPRSQAQCPRSTAYSRA